MRARGVWVVVAVGALAGAAGACASANGYDPSRYSTAPAQTAVDPETEPLPRTRPIRIRDPRAPVEDAGTR